MMMIIRRRRLDKVRLDWHAIRDTHSSHTRKSQRGTTYRVR